MKEILSIDSKPFEILKQQFNDILVSTVKQLSGSEEGEVTVKVKIKNDYFGDNQEQLDLNWDITKAIKTKKFKVSGFPKDAPVIEIKDDGTVTVYTLEQVSLFDKCEDEDEDDESVHNIRELRIP